MRLPTGLCESIFRIVLFCLEDHATARGTMADRAPATARRLSTPIHTEPVALIRPWDFAEAMPTPKKPRTLSVILSPEEVVHTQRLKHNALIVPSPGTPVFSIVAMITPAPRKCHPDRQS